MEKNPQEIINGISKESKDKARLMEIGTLILDLRNKQKDIKEEDYKKIEREIDALIKEKEVILNVKIETPEEFKPKNKKGLTPGQLAGAVDVDFEDVKNEESKEAKKTENNQGNIEKKDFRKIAEGIVDNSTRYFMTTIEKEKEIVREDKNIEGIGSPSSRVEKSKEIIKNIKRIIEIKKSGKDLAKDEDLLNEFIELKRVIDGPRQDKVLEVMMNGTLEELEKLGNEIKEQEEYEINRNTIEGIDKLREEYIQIEIKKLKENNQNNNEQKEGDYETQKAEIERRRKEAKKVHDDSVLTAADNGFVVKKSKNSYSVAKDLRTLIQKEPSKDSVGVMYKYKMDNDVYHVAVSMYDEKRGAGIGYVGYTVKVDEGTILTDEEIYSILEKNLYGVFEQGFIDKNNWKTDPKRSIDNIDKVNDDIIIAKYDEEYLNAFKKGEMTKEQALSALEEAGRKNSEVYKKLESLENKKEEKINNLGKEKDEILNGKEDDQNNAEQVEGDYEIKKREIEKYIADRIIFTGTDGGFLGIADMPNEKEGAGTGADVRRKFSDDHYEVIVKDEEHRKSLFKDIKFSDSGYIYSWHLVDNYINKGKKYLVVGITNMVRGTGLDLDRNGSIFASIEDTSKLPQNIEIFIEKQLIEKYKEMRKKRPMIYDELPNEFMDKFNARYNKVLDELKEKFNKNKEEGQEESPVVENLEEEKKFELEKKWSPSEYQINNDEKMVYLKDRIETLNRLIVKEEDNEWYKMMIEKLRNDPIGVVESEIKNEEEFVEIFTNSKEEKSKEEHEEKLAQLKKLLNYLNQKKELSNNGDSPEEIIEPEKGNEGEMLEEENEENKDGEENSPEDSGWTDEKERELQEMIKRHEETKAEIAELLELINQLPDDDEEEDPKETEKTEALEIKNENKIEGSYTTIGYADAILSGKIRNKEISSEPREDTVFEILKDNNGKIKLGIWKGAEKRVLKNPFFADGAEKMKIGEKPVLLEIELGELQKDDEGGYFVKQKPKIEFRDKPSTNET